MVLKFPGINNFLKSSEAKEIKKQKSLYWSTNASSIRDVRNENNYSVDWNTGVATSINDDFEPVIPIQLPDGADLLDVQVLGTFTGNWRMKRVTTSDGTHIDVTPAGVKGSTEATNEYGFIENRLYSYHIAIDLVKIGEIVRGVIIHYTI